MRYGCLLLSALLLAGCSAVRSPSPFGTSPLIKSVGGDTIEGIWEYEDQGSVLVEILDSKKGTIRVKELSDHPDALTFTAHLLVGDKCYYASVPAAKDGTSANGYFFALIKRSTNKCIVWQPDEKKFRDLVANGTIPGTLDKGDVYISAVTPELIKMIEEQQNGLLFKWQEPHILRKKMDDGGQQQAAR